MNKNDNEAASSVLKPGMLVCVRTQQTSFVLYDSLRDTLPHEPRLIIAPIGTLAMIISTIKGGTFPVKRWTYLLFSNGEVGWTPDVHNTKPIVL